MLRLQWTLYTEKEFPRNYLIFEQLSVLTEVLESIPSSCELTDVKTSIKNS